MGKEDAQWWFGGVFQQFWRKWSSMWRNLNKFLGKIYNDIIMKVHPHLTRLLNPILYKAVFHGKHRSIWNAVMEIPEVNKIKSVSILEMRMMISVSWGCPVYPGPRPVCH